MIELRFVGDRSDDVAGVEAKGRSERRECCDKHRDDDFDKIFSVHSCFVLGLVLYPSRRKPCLVGATLRVSERGQSIE